MEMNFFARLKETYQKTLQNKTDEYEIAYKIIEKIEKALDGMYELFQPINIGGAGIVIT